MRSVQLSYASLSVSAILPIASSGELELVVSVAEATPGDVLLQDREYGVEEAPRLVVPVVLRDPVEQAVGLLCADGRLVDHSGDQLAVLDHDVVGLPGLGLAPLGGEHEVHVLREEEREELLPRVQRVGALCLRLGEVALRIRPGARGWRTGPGVSMVSSRVSR